jgi:2'-5' RNA ligase
VLDGIGVFSEDFLRVVWVGLKPGEKFEELHVQADELLSPLLPKEKRFKPHLTLARIKLVGNKKQFLEALAKIRVEQKTFVVKKLVLFRSKLSPKGAVHEPVMEVLAQDL